VLSAGRVLMRSIVLPAVMVVAATTMATAQGKRSDLDGVWILADSAKIEGVKLTPAGEAAKAKYDHIKDDPDMRCIPATITRVMHTPSPPLEIRQRGNEVRINYEFMDVRRRVPVKAGLAAKDAPYAVAKYPHLGRSVAHYEGETLVIETVDHGAGVLDTLGVPGLYQSNQMRTVERYTADGDRMRVVVTHADPVYFQQPFTVTFTHQKLADGKIMDWDCVPSEAGYDRFKKPTRSQE
jgi:hypothetical protein